MTLLAGITGNKSSAYNAQDLDVENVMGENSLVNVTTISAAMELASSRLFNLLNTSEAIEAIKPEGASGRQLARMMVAQSLTDLDLSDDDAVTATIGMESESSDLGLEAWSTIKEYAVTVIEWIQKKWKELKRFVMKYFNKFFGDVERLKKSWVSIQAKAKDRQSDYTLEKNSKHEFEKGAECFYTSDTLIAGDKLVDGINEYRTIGEVIKEKILAYEVVELDESDIISEGGNSVLISQVRGKVKLTDLIGEMKKSLAGGDISDSDPDKFKGLTGKHSVDLLGRVRMYAGHKVLSDVAEDLKSHIISMGDLVPDQKKKAKANMPLVSANVVESIADANIELLDTLINIKRSKLIDKAQDNLDKASKGLDKWKKNAPDSDADENARAAFRRAVKIATEYFTVSRKLLVSMPLEFANQAKTVSSMQKLFCTKSLSAHKKD